MAHLIMDDNRFAERLRPGKRAWHALGTPFEEDAEITVVEALATAGADFSVIKVPEYAKLPNGEFFETGKFLVYREEHAFQGQVSPGKIVSPDPVSSNYALVQNIDIARMLEPLAKTWPVETVGALKDGAVLFISLYGGKFDIHGDENEMFFLVSDGKDGRKALSIDCTPVRVVCANTLTMGLAASHFQVKIAHADERRVLDDVSYWSEAIPQIAETARRTKEALAALAEVKATPMMEKAVIEAAFPLPGGSSKVRNADFGLTLSEKHKAMLDRDLVSLQYSLERITGIRELARESIEVFNVNNPKVAGTLYAVANGVNEVAMWRKGHEGAIPESSVFGNRAAESARAFKKAFSFVN